MFLFRVFRALFRFQVEYRRYSARLRAIFGDSRFDDVYPSDIAQYLDDHQHKVTANREISMLSGVFQWALRRGLTDKNPCRGIKRNTEKKRKRHIEDWELAVLSGAAHEQLGCIVDLVLLTALRKRDVLKIRLADLTNPGFRVEISKTGQIMVFEWTPELREVVDRARSLRRPIASIYLFANLRGQPYTISGFDSIWQRLMRKLKLGFTFHDLRARALTDAKAQGCRDYAQALAGHADGTTTERYIRNREIQRVRPINRAQNDE